MGTQTISKTIRHNDLDYKVGVHGKIFFHSGVSWCLSNPTSHDLPKIKRKLKDVGAL